MLRHDNLRQKYIKLKISRDKTPIQATKNSHIQKSTEGKKATYGTKENICLFKNKQINKQKTH